MRSLFHGALVGGRDQPGRAVPHAGLAYPLCGIDYGEMACHRVSRAERGWPGLMVQRLVVDCVGWLAWWA